MYSLTKKPELKMSRIFKISSCINIGDLCTHHDHFGHFPKSDFGKIEKIFLKHIFDLKVCLEIEAIVVYVRFQVVHHRFTGSKQGSRLHGSSRKFQKMHKYSRLPILGSQTPVSSPSSIIISCYATREGIFTTMEVKY